MRVIRTSFTTAFSVFMLLLAGCGSSGIDDILGGGDPTRIADDVRGTVESVDRGSRTIIVDVDQGYRTDLRGGSGDEVAIYYDDRTIVEFDGRSYRPEDLERGDRIAAEVDDRSGRLVADQIEVLYDVTSGTGSTTYPDTSGSVDFGEVRGEVRFVDTGDRTIELEDTTYSRGFNPGTGSRQRQRPRGPLRHLDRGRVPGPHLPPREPRARRPGGGRGPRPRQPPARRGDRGGLRRPRLALVR